jgi:hypothetical protein
VWSARETECDPREALGNYRRRSEETRLELGLRLSHLILAGEQSGLLTAHRDDGKRFVVRADEKMTAFLELERVTRKLLRFPNAEKFGTIRAIQPFERFSIEMLK